MRRAPRDVLQYRERQLQRVHECGRVLLGTPVLVDGADVDDDHHDLLVLLGALKPLDEACERELEIVELDMGEEHAVNRSGARM